MRIPEGQALSDLFDDVCDGIATEVDFAKHVDLIAQPPLLPGAFATSSEALEATDTVFLLIRNECSEKIQVTVAHDIDLVLSFPMHSLKYIAQVCFSARRFR